MRKILLVLFFLSMSAILFAQVQEAWVAKTQYEPLTRFDRGNNVVTDAAGNVYVVGTVFDDDGLVDDNYRGGMVTIKYDKFGTLVWKERFVMVGLKGSDIEVDGDGNVYVVGYRNLGSAFDTRHSDFVTIRYNHIGVLQWFRMFSGPQQTGNSAYLGLDNAGNVYIAGTSWGEDDDVSSGELGDYAIVKYDRGGEKQWDRRYNGAAPNNRIDELKGMIVDPAGNVYVTGTSQKDGRINTTTIKYNTEGTELWVSRHSKDEFTRDEGNDITYDQFGNVYVTGGFFGGQGWGYETIMYNSEGVQQWVAYYESPDNYQGTAVSLVVDNDLNCYIVGDNIPDGDLPSGSPRSINIIKYNSSGEQQWITNYNSNPPGSFYFQGAIGIGLREYADHIARIVIGNDGNIYIGTSSWSAENGVDFLTLKFGSSTGGLLWEKRYNSSADEDNVCHAMWLDASDNIYVTGQSREAKSYFTTIKYTQCNIICPSNITVNNDPGKCDAIVNFNPATYSGDCGSTFTYSHNTGIAFPVGVTTVTVISDATGATCSFTITVVDNEKPVITTCPSSKSVNTDPGVCFATAASVNAGLASASDNCNPVGVVGIRSDGASLGANYPIGTTTITWTATDPSGNTATCSQEITVIDNDPPEITEESASTYVLSPPNHTMRDVRIDYSTTDNCSVTSVITVESNEPINGVGDGDTDPDWIVVDNHNVKLRAERSAKGTGRIYTITITATDPSGNTAVKTIEVKVPHNIKNPHSGKAFIVGSTVSFEGEFWDKPGNKHTAKWLIDGSTTAKATVTEPSGNKNGKVIGSYKFTTPGVYKLRMNVTDQSGVTHYASTAGDLEAIVVIYDPNGGHAYGGGYFNSPAGALKTNPSSTGKASYGFAMNYFKNSTNPKGETQFEFKVGDFEFNALNFEYLVINSSMAQFKGTGKIIGGQSGVGFTMTVVDGQMDGTGIDKIRMKIYNKNNNAVIYDNQFGSSDAALPTQAVGENSVVVIQSSKTITSRADANEPAIAATMLQAKVLPNPSNSAFNIVISSNNAEEKVMMQVVDAYGRLIELRRNLSTGAVITLGNEYSAGIYFVRIMQGHAHKQLKLIKL